MILLRGALATNHKRRSGWLAVRITAEQRITGKFVRRLIVASKQAAVYKGVNEVNW